MTARNFPNPFSQSTTISFQVSQNIYETAIIQIFDATGRLVAEYHVNVEGAGKYELFWNPSETNPDLPAGMFAYSIRLQGESLSGRMVYRSRYSTIKFP
ncbi:T9SS type A sorting domain-containing protein [Bacteroidota bacterium]